MDRDPSPPGDRTGAAHPQLLRRGSVGAARFDDRRRLVSRRVFAGRGAQMGASACTRPRRPTHHGSGITKNTCSGNDNNDCSGNRNTKNISSGNKNDNCSGNHGHNDICSGNGCTKHALSNRRLSRPSHRRADPHRPPPIGSDRRGSASLIDAHRPRPQRRAWAASQRSVHASVSKIAAPCKAGTSLRISTTAHPTRARRGT
jgi:hypothetical protein